MRIILLILSILILPVAIADVYRSVDENGNVVFSDKPSPDAEKMDVQGVQTIDPGNVPEYEYSPAKKEEPPAGNYNNISITSPENDQTLSSNDGIVNVSVSVSPPLKGGDTIALYLNGNLAMEGNGSFTLENMDRGTHTVSAAIKDNSGKEILRSDSVTFHIQRHSIQHKQSTVGKPPPKPAPKPAPAP